MYRPYSPPSYDHPNTIFEYDFIAIITCILAAHLRNTPLEQLWQLAHDVATVGKIPGAPVVEYLSVPSSYFGGGGIVLNLRKNSSI
jgi:hypothetical protein